MLVKRKNNLISHQNITPTRKIFFLTNVNSLLRNYCLHIQDLIIICKWNKSAMYLSFFLFGWFRWSLKLFIIKDPPNYDHAISVHNTPYSFHDCLTYTLNERNFWIIRNSIGLFANYWRICRSIVWKLCQKIIWFNLWFDIGLIENVIIWYFAIN